MIDLVSPRQLGLGLLRNSSPYTFTEQAIIFVKIIYYNTLLYTKYR